MKKFVNDPAAYVDEMLDGMVAAYPEQVRRVEDTNVLVRADAPVDGKVAVVSGGGSGHEPTHGGYVGPGMLDGAAAGEVFTSPTADEVQAMIEATDAGAGVLLVIGGHRIIDGFDHSPKKYEQADFKKLVLILGVLTVHSFPEGVAIGVSFGELGLAGAETIDVFGLAMKSLAADRDGADADEDQRLVFARDRIDSLLRLARIGERLLEAMLSGESVDSSPLQVFAHLGDDEGEST